MMIYVTVKNLSRHNKTKIQNTMYISVRKIFQCNRVWIFGSWALKTKDRQADNPAVTGSTVTATHCTTSDDKEARMTIPDFSEKKEKYYSNMTENLSKISRTSQSCRFHTKHGCEYLLTHWGLVARVHLYTSVTQAVICSDNGVSPEWHQAIIRTNAGILSTEPRENP